MLAKWGDEVQKEEFRSDESEVPAIGKGVALYSAEFWEGHR